MSRTIAQQLGPAVERANEPLHFALSTRGANALGMHCNFLNGAQQPPSRGLMAPVRTTHYLAPLFLHGLAEVDPTDFQERLFCVSESR